MHCTSTSRKIPVYSPENVIPLSLSEEIRVANKSMKCTLGEANCASTCSKAVSLRCQTKCSEYTPEERVKIGRCGAKNSLAKAAKFIKFKTSIMAEIAKFCRYTVYIMIVCSIPLSQQFLPLS